MEGGVKEVMIEALITEILTREAMGYHVCYKWECSAKCTKASLTLNPQDIAEHLGVHYTTVSRAVKKIEEEHEN